MAFHSFQETAAGIDGAIRASLPGRAMPVNLALAMVTNALVPVRAAVAQALTDADGVLALAAALELMHLSVHRLHRQLDHVSRDGLGLGLGIAADVLVGDYLSTGAFRLLVQCGDMAVMRVIAHAVQRACEAEMAVCQPALALDDPAAIAAAVIDCAAPLGEAAGTAGAVLARHGAAIAAIAASFGRHACVAHALASHAAPAARHARPELAAAGAAALGQARADAARLAALTGKQGPLALCAALEHAIAALPD